MIYTSPTTTTAEAKFIELYSEIRKQAHRIVKNEAPGCSVEATSLAHEAYECVVHSNPASDQFQDTEHLLNALTAKMQRILVDRARRRGAMKRGGLCKREYIAFDTIEVGKMEPAPLLSLGEALEGLKASAPESAQLVEWHVFLGLTLSATALKMGISRSKADGLWLHARHWLHRKMEVQG
jgi:RNA polymerase sigma factor (TIGR02999 family)